MYKYVYEEGKKGHPLFVVLHGTGGDEHNLVPIAQEIDPEASVLGVRGDVNENGMLRFFKRTGEGQYDVEDLFERGKKLEAFIIEKAEELGFALEDVILLGFSNGANMALHILLEEGSPFNTAFLMAPMYPVDRAFSCDLTGKHIFISAGKKDRIVPLKESEHVIDICESRGADVDVHWTMNHNITRFVMDDARAFYAKLKK